MGKETIRSFVPPNRVRPKQQDEGPDIGRKWLTVLMWVAIACVGINLLLWLISRGGW